MLSVSLNANGWTVVTPSSNTQIIYCSSSTGSDTNSGLSSSSPVQTLAKAQSLIRNDEPDWLLLKCGDVFNGAFANWTQSGVSAQEPILISSYGTGTRPLIDTGTASNGFSALNSTTPVNYLDVIGIQFYENNRDPASPTFSASSSGGTDGFEFYAPGGNLLIEDCQFSFYRNNLDIEGINGTLSNVTLRRNIVIDSWSTNTHSQGIYCYAVNNITVYQNVFDHNGWNTQISGAVQEGYNHDIYFSYNTTGVDIEQNILAEASFAGIMARSGGIILNNLFLSNTVAMAYGQANGADSTPGGVTGQISGNVVDGDIALGTLEYGQGFDIGNIEPGPGVLVSNNLFTGDTQQAKPAIQLDPATGTDNPSQAVGENNVTIEDNIVNGWWEGYDSDGRFVPGGTGLYGFNDVTVEDNEFINSTNRVVRHDGYYAFTQESWSGNEYYTSALTQPNWMLLQSNAISPQQWDALVDQTGVILSAPPNWADPTRSISSYDITLGGPGTLADFLANAENMYIYNAYQPQYMATAAIDYIQAGFTLDTTPPTAVATAANVGASSVGSTAFDFTVTYTDNFFLDPTSLGNADIFVTGPNGYSQLATFVGSSAPTTEAGGDQQTVATYQITPPNGSWAAGEDGQYTISLQPNQVRDKSGNYALSGTIGSFTADFTAPTALVAANGIGNSALGTSSYTFTVTYSDPAGINVSTLGHNELQVTGPNSYSKFATLVGETPPTNSTQVTATYTIPAPGGSWTTSSGGTYSITSVGAVVQDTYGNAMPAGLLASFNATFTGGPANSATGSITGTVYIDANGNGVLNSQETLLSGIVVYLDLNHDGKLDDGDPSATTNSSGVYTFSNLPAGQYLVREVVPSGYVITAPSTGVQTVTLAAGQNTTGVNFGDQLISSVDNSHRKPTRRR